jgi:lipopolysaccharide/colanic/teichoic acid biosynthesis glycosyltransferase
MKRIFDLVFATIGLIILSPLLVAIALARFGLLSPLLPIACSAA